MEGTQLFTWTVDDPGWEGGQTVAVKLTREDPDAAPPTPSGISVVDAQVEEAEGAALAFAVTLAEAQSSAVSVRYATADGTALSGADYVAVSGAIRFEAGQTQKTVRVPVLNDTHDEGSETLTLSLSRPFGAKLSDAQATGTIVNTGPIPQAWLARFGRDRSGACAPGSGGAGLRRHAKRGHRSRSPAIRSVAGATPETPLPGMRPTTKP